MTALPKEIHKRRGSYCVQYKQDGTWKHRSAGRFLHTGPSTAGRRGCYALLRAAAPFLLGAACLLTSVPARAQTLTETIQLAFGNVVHPSGSVSWAMDLSDTGSGTATPAGGITLTGEYLVQKGPGPNRSLFIDVAPNGSIPGITIDSFTASYDGSVISLPASGLPAPGTAGKVLRVGASLTITSSVSTGTHLPGITITVIKE